ncbi:hypothetical protein HJC23_000966 [Cyclotella cryptica]|uniref:Mut7-C RNAse domain-containing protein n=1 Tax=Cyclotella cryptica TaxID=29204 RepID=A0ABD3QMB8_9STRA|eukprot:CCRYP_004081-RA/>CCRYP_004081-RA protein AED:0.01 eAED:0.01 QI:136/1/1/1/1/1/2/78/864
MTPPSSSSTWVDQMRMVPLSSSDSCSNNTGSNNNNNTSSGGSGGSPLRFNIASFNLLAESYLSPRSHPGLPPSYAEVAFDTVQRRQLLVDTLKRFCCPAPGDSEPDQVKWDILALQELDLLAPNEQVLPALSSWGYQVVRTPTDQRRDCCAVAFDGSKFRLVKYEVVKFDDLATLDSKHYARDIDRGGENGRSQSASNQIAGSTFNTMKPNKSVTFELTGMVRSFLRRNCAIIVHLETRTDESNSGDEDLRHNERQSVIVASAHLYWHPGYEYVKLCQSKYLLDRAYAMASREANGQRIPTVICGDMNSKPGSIVHQFFTNGTVDARTVAPWHYFWDGDLEVMYDEEKDEKYASDRMDGQDPMVSSVGDSSNENDEMIGSTHSKERNKDNVHEHVSALENQFCSLIVESIVIEDDPTAENSSQSIPTAHAYKLYSYEVKDDILSNYNELQTTPASRRTNNHKSPQDYKHLTPTPNVKYMLDFTLNRFTRWLRILGIDAALETEEEERQRTQGHRIALFERCKKEKRTLITTSYKLLLRKDCPPGAYLLDPKSTSHLEQALPRLLRTHGVELSPCIFLTRCVVCNGIIHRVLTDDEKRSVFIEHGAPDLVDSNDDMEVFRCDGCRQGYWWDDRPSSSASRVFTQATKLLRLCLRGGVRIKNDEARGENDTKEVMGAFDFLDVKKEREYWELDNERREADLAVIEWLRDAKLSNPFHLRSAYYATTDEGSHSLGEYLPFSNVTSEFVGLLDYVFFEENVFEQVARLRVPTSFRALNASPVFKGHLLLSNIWPSDHLAVGAHLRLKESVKSSSSITNNQVMTTATTTQSIHPARCSCGCVPNIFSLFEMAELRKKARDSAKAAQKTT